MKKIFIGAPITHLIENNKFDIEIKNIITVIINELKNKNYEVFSAHIEEKFGQGKIEDDQTIVIRDLKWIDAADVCIFLFPIDKKKNTIRTDGTYIEIGYDIAKEKKVVIFYSDEERNKYSAMFKGLDCKDAVFIDFKDIYRTIEVI